MKTTSDVHTGITTTAVVKVPPTPVTAIPDTSNMTVTALPRSSKHVRDTKKMADRRVTIVDTLQHPPPTCPTRGQECRNCHKTNHFARVCNSKPVRQICFTHSSVSPSTSSDESVFMIIPSTSTKTPKVTALVNDSPVTFVLDTGASVNIISRRVYNGLKHRPAIHRTTIRLFAYRSQQAIPLRGFIDTTMKFRGKCFRYSWLTIKAPYLDCRICLASIPPKH